MTRKQWIVIIAGTLGLFVAGHVAPALCPAFFDGHPLRRGVIFLVALPPYLYAMQRNRGEPTNGRRWLAVTAVCVASSLVMVPTLVAVQLAPGFFGAHPAALFAIAAASLGVTVIILVKASRYYYGGPSRPTWHQGGSPRARRVEAWSPRPIARRPAWPRVCHWSSRRHS